ncbi:ABC transporter substrate-binding protein [Candidatus Formimonas warabiya]|uniref:ABC transporter substrate-binding protein n=1 Tax=Formimonas warabiya TaxID=1761012 RepID=A0A3G1KQN8_FORW1|nr:ABC transporter substrate-binding protein [Candidatus Formimonas warabiya]ATW24760.1 hypothetical protein DCMF_08220 [Candidatus Formimonas warabiya]
MKNKLSIAVATFILIFVFVIPTFAAKAPKVVLNGQTLTFDVQPAVIDGYTFVPVRTIFEALDCTVNFDPISQTVSAFSQKDGTTVKLIINGKAFINSNEVLIDAPAKLISGKAMVPLRFVGESLGTDVTWDKTNNLILITDNHSLVPSKPLEANDVKIGLNYELSGNVQIYGENTVKGIELAAEQINKNGGVLNGLKIQLVKADNKSNSKEAVSVQENLIKNQEIVASLGPATSAIAIAAGAIAMKYRVPLITTTGSVPSVTVNSSGSVQDYVFRNCFTDPYQGAAGAKFIFKSLGLKKVAILGDSSSDYSKGIISTFEKSMQSLGGKIVSKEYYVGGNSDFQVQLNKIKDSEAEVIYLPGYYNDAGQIIRQARTLGIDIPFVGGDGWDSSELVTIAGAEALNNTFFTNHFLCSDKDPVVQAFSSLYRNRYGENPDGFAALGYDAMYLLADAINRAGNVNGEDIKDALASTKEFKGLMGSLTMDQDHNPVKDVFVIEMVNGEQVLKERIHP